MTPRPIIDAAVMDAALAAVAAEKQWLEDCHAQYVDEALRYARAFGDDADAPWLSPLHARLITLAAEVKRLRGAA